MSDNIPSRKTSQALRNFAPWELKAIVRYLHVQFVDPSETHKLLTAACGEGAPSYKDVRQWIQEFLENQEDPAMIASMATGLRNGPSKDAPTDPALVARIELLILADKRISLNRISEMSIVSQHTAQLVVSNVLGLKRVCERWVPRLWTPEQRAFRVSVCKELQELHRNEGPDLLSRIVVGSESFALYYTPEITAATSPRKTSSTPGDKYKPSCDATRVYCYNFFDSKGMICSELLDTSDPPSAEEYANIITNSLIPAIKRKRGMDRTIYLLHDTTAAHISLNVHEALHDEKLCPLPHAPASPDLEPHEYWLYRFFFRQLEEHPFKSKADIWSAIQKHTHSLPDLEYNNAINKLSDRWNICIEKQGLYLL